MRSRTMWAIPMSERTPGTRPAAAFSSVRLFVGVGSLLAGMAALVTALLLGGGRPQPVPDGLPDAGPVTGWALPVAKVALDVGGIGTIGCLLLAAVLVGTVDGSSGRLSPLAMRAMRFASLWALGWCAAAIALLMLSLLNITGVPPSEVASPQVLRSLPWTMPLSRALIITAVAGLVLTGFARRTATRAGAAALLVLAVAALVPALFTGHAATTSDHDLATSSLVMHVVAASLWVGGLLALLACVRADKHVLAIALPRFSALALGCFVVVGLSGALNGFIRLGPAAGNWVSSYGALLVAKATALVVLGWMGRRHRARTVPAVLAGRPKAFLRLAGGELTVMAAAIGLAVALGRTPVPARVMPNRVSTHGGGHNTLSWEVLPWSPGRLLTEWRPDAVVLTAVGLALVAYLVGVRRLARVGQLWPVRRTVSTMAGLAVATFALCGGLASYSTAMFSVQVSQLLVMATVVPLLLTIGMPLALVLQVRGGGGHAHVYAGPRAHMTGRTARILGNPVNGLLLLVAFLVVLYATPLFELSLRYFTLHLFTNVLALACGLTFFWSALGVDVTPERRALKDRLKLIALFLLFLGAFGVVLVSGDRLYGLGWFMELGWWWADPVVDQRRGGEVVWAFALGLAPLTVLVMWTQWRFLRVRAEADGKPRA